MRILYLSQYFPPEAGATQTRAFEMARNWVQMGHSVTMVAEIPNHPSGIIPDHYRGKIFERKTLEGIDVVRVWVQPSQKKNFRNRLVFYLSYMLSAAVAGILLARERYDLLYATTPPLFVAGSALAICSGVISFATMSRYLTASASPPSALRLNQRWACTLS